VLINFVQNSNILTLFLFSFLLQHQAVKISNIKFSNICGTCIDENAIVLDCAKLGCYDITLNQIKITSINRKKPASVKCNNVHGTATNIISPKGSCVNH